MSRHPRYDILFEPVPIGPVVARNRFYQVPHCNGMGYRDATAVAVMRGIKAEGGWSVVCTEQTEIHHSSDINPFIELRIWDDRDIPMLAGMVDRIHEHDALAGIELAYNGLNGPNHYGREVPMAPTAMPVASFSYDPVQAKEMSLQDIRDVRRWHRAAALRARRAGFDLIYVYAGHALGFFHHFLSRRYNHRSDEYGGSLENRARLLKEIITDTKEAVGDTAAVPCRISLDELMGPDGLEKNEVLDVIGMMAELPDLWDVCLAGWENDSQTSRFGPEGAQEPYFATVKNLTTRPVVGVGRYTSPDRMVSLVKSGKLDFIGCARPSIADPYLPKKIEEGRIEDIRECIGCNICVSGDFLMSPMRCTQNPSMSEEWRRGWHPERIRGRGCDEPVLIVGAGPCGLEAAQMLGKRGYNVTVAEAGKEAGGRVTRESRLPGLSAWRRVVDYRMQQIHKLPEVELHFASELTAADVLELDFRRVALATGSRWRRDGVGRHWTSAVPGASETPILTPDDIMAGARPPGSRIAIWDDDHYYMGGVLAELLISEGCEVVFITPAPEVSSWTRHTMEQHLIQKKLIEMGVAIYPNLALSKVAADVLEAKCVFTGQRQVFEVDSTLLVTSRKANDELAAGLHALHDSWADAGLESVTLIGDSVAPATIAHAVFAGRKFAEELDAADVPNDVVAFRREITELVDREGGNYSSPGTP
ncbi:MAG: NAD(P)-binding protein [Rhodobacteraceae bacterium]|nr:NAD(P)-binding protein [Paracoccaceae bacterium]